MSRTEYLLNPKICINCKVPIEFIKRINNFCSKTCANSYNNKRRLTRSEHSRSKTSSALVKYHSQHLKKDVKSKKVVARSCKTCSNVPAKKFICCSECIPNAELYKKRAAFKFNVFDYPEEFNLSLVKELGWYSPNGRKSTVKTVNKGGVSRDHLYSVLDGRLNQRDPKLLGHPANCRIMVHNGPNGNNSKKSRSLISWDDLIIKIQKWDEKYNDKVCC